MLDLLSSNPLGFLILLFCLVISIGIHEYAHAVTAYKLGDSTPKNQGRVTLNPFSHIDSIGLLMVIVAGFGWGKPVEFDIYNLRNPKRDVLLIALAGPLSNILLAFGLHVYATFFGTNIVIEQLLILNLVLAVFNLLPIAPLDGFNIVTGLLPYDIAYKWRDLEPYGIFILLGLVFLGGTSYILTPAISIIRSFFNILI
jgi:Zn-dependent protease